MESLLEYIQRDQECYFGTGLVLGKTMVPALLGYDKTKDLLAQEHTQEILLGIAAASEFEKTGKLPKKCIDCGQADIMCKYISRTYEISKLDEKTLAELIL